MLDQKNVVIACLSFLYDHPSLHYNELQVPTLRWQMWQLTSGEKAKRTSQLSVSSIRMKTILEYKGGGSFLFYSKPESIQQHLLCVFIYNEQNQETFVSYLIRALGHYPAVPS